jgi:hypothetical protein
MDQGKLQMPKLSEMDLPMRQQVLAELRTHLELLREQHNDHVAHARKYLTLTNGGAIVATLAFLNSQPGATNSVWVWVSLGLFLVGLIAVGVLIALTYVAGNRAFLNWLDDFDRFHRDEVELGVMFARLNAITRPRINVAAMSGWASFGAFIIGSILAVIVVSHERINSQVRSTRAVVSELIR